MSRNAATIKSAGGDPNSSRTDRIGSSQPTQTEMFIPVETKEYRVQELMFGEKAFSSKKLVVRPVPRGRYMGSSSQPRT